MLQKAAAMLWRLHFGGCNGSLPLLAHLTLEIIVVYQVLTFCGGMVCIQPNT